MVGCWSAVVQEAEVMAKLPGYGGKGQPKSPKDLIRMMKRKGIITPVEYMRRQK